MQARRTVLTIMTVLTRMRTGLLLAAVRDGAWLTEQKFPPMRYAIGGLIPEGLTIKVARRRPENPG